MNNMTEEGLEGSGDCVICFNKIENYDVLPDQESQKIINNSWNYLHDKIAHNKFQSGKSIDENHQQCCKKCFDAASELIQIAEHVKKCEKQISDLSFEFSLGVLARRTQAASINNKSDDSPKEFIVLDVSRISPSLFSMDQPNPTKTEEFEPCANNFVEMDAVLNVPQDPLVIVNQEFNEYYNENSQIEMLECPEEMANLIENHLMEAEDIQDGVTISNTTKNNPASRSDMGLFMGNNISSQIDDSRSTCSDSCDSNDTIKSKVFRKPVATLTKVKVEDKWDVSDEFNSKRSLNPSIKHPLRNKSSNKKIRQPTTVSKIIPPKTFDGKKKVRISGSSLEAHEILVKCKKIQTAEKPFVCSYCAKAFSSSSHVKRHEMIHTGEKPFKCFLCAKAFNRSCHVKRHEMIHFI